MVRVSPAEMARCKAAVRKAKRNENASFQASIGAVARSESARPASNACSTAPGTPKRATGKRKRRKAIPARKRAFARLKALCVAFVLLRAKKRSDGFCEVGMVCGGRGPAEVWYHVWPQALGNALKYDVRAILCSCHSCNGGEYFARKRGADTYVKRHMEILGPLYNVLDALKGRRQISTAEAIAMGDELQQRIEAGEFV